MGIHWKNLGILAGMLVLAGALLSNGLAAGWESAFPPLKQDAWEEECGACHLAFTPGMLPARSWKKMMSNLKNHFGDDAAIGPTMTREITEFLVANAADNPGATEVMKRIARSIPPTQTPLRITETPLFHYYHDEIPESIWQRESIGLRSNCAACHQRAAEGRYLQREIEIPKQ
ncbi:MAG: hypothetical protein Kow006_02300 [Gammaproteobacteria bacterium]